MYPIKVLKFFNVTHPFSLTEIIENTKLSLQLYIYFKKTTKKTMEVTKLLPSGWIGPWGVVWSATPRGQMKPPPNLLGVAEQPQMSKKSHHLNGRIGHLFFLLILV
jgi:hypothetical protein